MLALPVIIHSQTKTFIKLTDPKNQLIKGESVTKGFEGWIMPLTTGSSGKNNTQYSFTMNISIASADLKRAMASGELLMTGQINVMNSSFSAGAPKPVYNIKMEKIKVLTCTESLGCNGVMTTSVTLQATRIGWTYYQTDRTGTLAVSNKYGYDAETGTEWTNF
ncbi:type VI secretion system tube protein Hcp [Lutibacter sp.]|uniref:type VI secretion system tube protein Hcp n=1 Tax=Lutibacter sp. TaxID=1925666 RepID=UPI00273450B5|nr:type VI secretion system tube protein Hcp [Lutibacter sp.]MDP3312744.1 type VI secretion system tube protein Hcp [Lutibacter sp.]